MWRATVMVGRCELTVSTGTLRWDRAKLLGVARADGRIGSDTARRDRRDDGCTDAWILPAVGAGIGIGVDAAATASSPGDLIKFDCGTTVGGYRSDGGCTFSFREIRPSARELYGVLAQAHAIARPVAHRRSCSAERTSVSSVPTD